MLDGVLDIPLRGIAHQHAAAPTGTAALGNFLAGPENRLVEVAVRAVAAKTANGYNPLVIYGPSGTGKSHIAAGMAAAWRADKRRRKVVHVSATDFASNLADAIDTHAVDEFRAKHRGADLLIIEDLHRLVARRSEKLNTQEELVHTLDAMTAAGRWVIVTASAAPVELAGIIPSLQSRLSGGLCVPLSMPGPETRLAILRRLADTRGADLPDPVARLLAESIRGTAPELAGALMELTTAAVVSGNRLDLSSVREYLERRNRADLPDMHAIARAAARHFRVKVSDMRGPGRSRSLVVARDVAMYAARRWGQKSYEEIGRYFGGRDHSTVLHGCRKTEKAIDADPSIRQAVERLQSTVWKK